MNFAKSILYFQITSLDADIANQIENSLPMDIC
jgi:hypothetical protein